MFLAGVSQLGLSAGGTGGVIINSDGSTATAATVSAGGTNYAVGDTITPTGGTALRSVVLTVSSLSGSAVASVTVTDGGLYSAQPGNPVSQGSTSGSGSGATFNITWATANLISDLAGTYLWDELGATSYMAGAMAQRNGLALANYIGAANLANAISTNIPLPEPQCYLTPTSNTPIITTDALSATAIFYSPFKGLWAIAHNGTTLVPIQLAGQLQLTLTASQAANNIYDVFLAYNGGTPVIGTGPSWTGGTGGSVTAGSCARGTGTGGTALQRLLGVWTNAASISLIYNTGGGNNTITVPANQGIYLGSIFIDGTNGQVTCHRSYGQSRKWGIWNCFNRTPIIMQCGDPTASWSYGTNTFRPSNNNTANNLTCFIGLPEEETEFWFTQNNPTNSNNANMDIGIGYNSTTSPAGLLAGFHALGFAPGSSSYPTITAELEILPGVGIQTITSLERATGSWTFQGTSTNTLLASKYRG